jgi:hypothetical protein
VVAERCNNKCSVPSFSFYSVTFVSKRESIYVMQLCQQMFCYHGGVYCSQALCDIDALYLSITCTYGSAVHCVTGELAISIRN